MTWRNLWGKKSEAESGFYHSGGLGGKKTLTQGVQTQIWLTNLLTVPVPTVQLKIK